MLIADDEPFSLQWLVEYVESFGCDVVFSRTVTDAQAAMRGGRLFKAIIVDLGIPAPANQPVPVASARDAYSRYPGLYIAHTARNSGYSPERVIVYSVHDSDDVDRELGALQCTYLLKGRPRQAKEALAPLLRRGPTKRRY